MTKLLQVRPKMTTVLAVLLIVAGLTLALAREAIAAYTFDCSSATPCGYDFPRDTDGNVAEAAGDLNPGPPQPRQWHVLGQTSWWQTTSGPYVTIVDDSIEYDWPETDWCEVPRYKVRNHERAHSRGWAHWEKPAWQNDAYDPEVQRCSR